MAGAGAAGPGGASRSVQAGRLRVYAGEELPVDGVWYSYTVNGTLYVVVVYPERAVYAVDVVYPTVNLTEERVAVKGAAPGSRLTVYCEANGSEVVLVDYTATASEYELDLPPVGCASVRAVYRHGWYTLVVYANEPEPVSLASKACTAGEPCVPLEPSPWIAGASIDGVPYEPGETVRLAAGAHTVTVRLVDGHVVRLPLHVRPVTVLVVAWENRAGGWEADVVAPDYAVVRVALSDGSVLDLPPGHYTLHARPVSAWWPYGDARVTVAATLPLSPRP